MNGINEGQQPDLADLCQPCMVEPETINSVTDEDAAGEEKTKSGSMKGGRSRGTSITGLMSRARAFFDGPSKLSKRGEANDKDFEIMRPYHGAIASITLPIEELEKNKQLNQRKLKKA